jgi:NAD(P)-dependent dehydrogenase (short-subunit alcohol dehydrogenase family)
MARLAGKRALITGGTSGIGLATARRFLDEGARVAITGGKAASLDEARGKLGDVLTICADAGDVAAQSGVAKEVKDNFGGLDVLFVNAGVGDFRPIENWDEDSFDRSFAVNLKGPFFLIQALAPLLARPASVILNASVNIHIGMPASSVYAATKAGLLSLARTLSGELLARGVRFNAISPGPIATPLHGKIGMGESEIAGLVAQIPAGRRGDPNEIAEAAVFLASDASAFMVGAELVIDGGMTTLEGRRDDAARGLRRERWACSPLTRPTQSGTCRREIAGLFLSLSRIEAILRRFVMLPEKRRFVVYL